MVTTKFEKAQELIAELRGLGVAVDDDILEEVKELSRERTAYGSVLTDHAPRLVSLLVASETDPSITYVVSVLESARYIAPVSCTCDDFRYRSVTDPNHSCKHMHKVAGKRTLVTAQAGPRQ